MLRHSFFTVPAMLAAVGLLTWSSCRAMAAEAPEKPKEEAKDADPQPDVARPCEAAKPAGANQQGAADKPTKQIWAQSFLFCDAPKFEMSTWLTDKPELKGKFVLIEFWRTWCGACKRSVPLLNSFHEKYGKELVVIAVTGEPEETVKAYDGPKMSYFMALDAPSTKDENDENDEAANKIKDQGATEESFGVYGWPHVVLLEPENHCVIWEGFPLLKGYELTAEKIEKALSIGRKNKTEK